MHIIQERLLTALTEKTAGKVICHGGYASRSNSYTTERSSGHYIKKFAIYFYKLLLIRNELEVPLFCVCEHGDSQ